MTYTISGAGFGKDTLGQEAISNGNSINIKENNNKAEGVHGAFSAIVMSGCDNIVNKDNTYEALLKEAEDVKGQIMASASTAKLSLKALAMKLSGAGAVKLDEDGFNLTDATGEDMVNIIEKIRIELSMHCDNYVAYGTTPDAEAIESVAGSAGMANAVEAKLNSVSIPAEEDNVEEVNAALDKASSLTELTENQKIFMIRNDISPTIEGLYHAQHACSGKNGAGKVSPVTDGQFQEIRQQIEKVINNAGLPVNDSSLNNARLFLENNIPVTEENLLFKNELDNIDLADMSSENKKNVVLDRIADNLATGGRAQETMLTEGKSVLSQVRETIDTLDTVTFNDVENVVNKGKEVTLNNLKEEHFAYKNIDEAVEAGRPENKEKTAASYNFLMETRILMTAKAGVFLAKSGMSLMTVSIDTLAMNLRNIASGDDEFKDVFEQPEETINQVLQVNMALLEIKEAPLQIFGELYGNADVQEKLTISTFSQLGSNLKRDFDRLNHNYEMVGTEVRSDLGDSIDKAVKKSAADILDSLELEYNKANREALHILAMNGMEMSKENVDVVKNMYATLKNLIDNMKPETVLNMLNNGINPMEDDIRSVNEYLNEVNNSSTADNEEKFARFLFKLDRTNGIDEQTRKDFIGVYQMMNIFRRDAGTAIGMLLKQGRDITMGNLMTAYNSRKASGIDMTVNDETGMAEVSGHVNYYLNIFRGSQHLVTPNTLKNVDERYDYKAQSVEKFCEELEENYDTAVETQLNEEYIKELAGALSGNERQEHRYAAMLENAGMEATLGNISAVRQLAESGIISAFMGGSGRWKEFSDNTIEKIGRRNELEKIYDAMEETAKDELNQALEAVEGTNDTNRSVVTYDKLNTLRISHRQIGFIRNLARRNDYRIPVTSENGVGLIKLTLISDNDNRGRISIKLDSDSFGEVSAEAKVEEHSIGLFVISNGEKKPDEIMESLPDILKKEFGFESVHTYLSESHEVPYITYDGAEKKIPTEKLYKIAETLVKAFTGVN